MELKEFIRQTLFEITEGVREANEAYKAYFTVSTVSIFPSLP